MPSATAQIPGKYLCFFVTEKQHVEPEDLVLSVTKMKDFFVKREVKKIVSCERPNRI